MIKMAMKSCTKIVNFWRKSLEISPGGALAPDKCKLQLLAFDLNTYSYRKHYPARSCPKMLDTSSQHGEYLIFDGEIDDYRAIEKLEPDQGRKLLEVQLAADGNCTDEFKARKAQSEKAAVQLS